MPLIRGLIPWLKMNFFNVIITKINCDFGPKCLIFNYYDDYYYYDCFLIYFINHFLWKN